MRIANTTRVLVTGAGSGIGAAIALEAARRGALVLATDIDAAAAEATARACRKLATEAKAARLDVTNAGDWQHNAREVEAGWGGLDLLINNAGIGALGRIDELPIAIWRQVFEVNFWGVVLGCRTFLPILSRQGTGHILNVASLAGLTPVPEFGPYNAAKAGVIAVTETLALELRASGIGVTALCPGFVKTRIFDNALGQLSPLTRAFRGSMEAEKTTVARVAARALDGVEQGQLYVLPMREARQAWLLRRLMPATFLRRIWPAVERGLRKAHATGDA